MIAFTGNLRIDFTKAALFFLASSPIIPLVLSIDKCVPGAAFQNRQPMPDPDRPCCVSLAKVNLSQASRIWVHFSNKKAAIC
jgi:hypothetical protein